MGEIIQSFGTVDLSFVPGDDFPFELTFPFDISGYTIIAKIGSLDLKVDKVSEYIVVLTADSFVNLANKTPWYLKLIKDGITRTYIKGVYKRI